MGLIGALLLIIYGGGAWKFWMGFDRTPYSQSRLMLTLLWPGMLISPAYRQNFIKAMKG